MPWWQRPTYHNLDKFTFIIYSHQPIKCLLPRQQSGQSRERTTQLHTPFTGPRITSTYVVVICASVNLVFTHIKKYPVITNLVMHVVYVCVYTHTHTHINTYTPVCVNEEDKKYNIRIHSQCTVHIWFQDLWVISSKRLESNSDTVIRV